MGSDPAKITPLHVNEIRKSEGPVRLLVCAYHLVHQCRHHTMHCSSSCKLHLKHNCEQLLVVQQTRKYGYNKLPACGIDVLNCSIASCTYVYCRQR